MKVVVSGGTGFVGAALVKELLARGDEVVVLTRGPSRTDSKRPGLSFVQWQPLEMSEGHRAVDGADAVVNLAGEVLVGRRLTQALEKSARQSRVTSTQLLAEAMTRAANPPRVFVSGSAVGYYGSHPSSVELSEEDPPGRDFMALLALDWEAAARAAPSTTRVVQTRLGIVMGPGGGALEAMSLPFKMFVGGKLGDGRQIVSWIHLDDAVRGLIFCIDTTALRGPVNLCAPAPVDNSALSEILASALHRPNLLPVPGAALKALFGKGATAILEGQRVIPKKLLESGFVFSFPEARAAIEDALASKA